MSSMSHETAIFIMGLFYNFTTFYYVRFKKLWGKSCKIIKNKIISLMLLKQGVESKPGPASINLNADHAPCIKKLNCKKKNSGGSIGVGLKWPILCHGNCGCACKNMQNNCIQKLLSKLFKSYSNKKSSF